MPLMISLYASFPVSSSLWAPCRPALLHSWSRCSGGVRSLSSSRLNVRPHCGQMPGVWVDSFCAIHITPSWKCYKSSGLHASFCPFSYGIVGGCAFPGRYFLDWHILNVNFWLLMSIYTISIQCDIFIMFIVLILNEFLEEFWHVTVGSEIWLSRQQK